MTFNFVITTLKRKETKNDTVYAMLLFADFLNSFYLSVTDESFVDERRVWRKQFQSRYLNEFSYSKTGAAYFRKRLSSTHLFYFQLDSNFAFQTTNHIFQQSYK